MHKKNELWVFTNIPRSTTIPIGASFRLVKSVSMMQIKREQVLQRKKNQPPHPPAATLEACEFHSVLMNTNKNKNQTKKIIFIYIYIFIFILFLFSPQSPSKILSKVTEFLLSEFIDITPFHFFDDAHRDRARNPGSTHWLFHRRFPFIPRLYFFGFVSLFLAFSVLGHCSCSRGTHVSHNGHFVQECESI